MKILLPILLGSLSVAAYLYGYHVAAGLFVLIAFSLIVYGFVAEHDHNTPGGFDSLSDANVKKSASDRKA